MGEPVLVLHGVATRSQAAFERRVNMLQGTFEGRWTFVPVFWGDLGADPGNIRETIPDVSGQPNVTTRGDRDRSELVLAGARASRELKVEVPSTRANDDEIAAAIREEFPKTRYLRDADDEALLVAGEIIGASVLASDAATTGSAISVRGKRNIREHVRETLQGLDRFAGAIMGESLGVGIQSLRRTWSKGTVDFLGDVLVYQRRQALIQQRIFTALQVFPKYGTPENPVYVLAHSLGGVIAVDAATRALDPLWIRGLVTLGSQSSFFQAIDPRAPLAPYMPDCPVVLPPTIDRWTNLWEPLDPLAFIAANVFQLASGKAPLDVAVEHFVTYGIYVHGIYWDTPELEVALTRTFV
jgi:hypothetical protein